MRALARTALAASILGYPLSQAVTRGLGRPGAALVEAVCVGLLVRDVVLITRGTPHDLRTGPAALLWLETAAAAVAAATTLPLVLDDASHAAASGRGVEVVRRLSVASLFWVHSVRFWQYLQPDQGLGGSETCPKRRDGVLAHRACTR